MFFKNCIEEFTAPKAKAVDSTLEEVETVTQVPRDLPFFGASIDKPIPILPDLDFDGMIVTSIDYEKQPDEQNNRPNRITFSGSTKGHGNPRREAIFVRNVKNIGGNTYEGDLMSNDTAYDFFQHHYSEYTPLFFIHGFNNEPDYTLSEVQKANNKMKEKGYKHWIVPVIWPSEGSGAGYSTDRYKNVPEAAEEIKLLFDEALKEGTKKFERKNLICHSMGTYLLRKAARKLQGLQFDNIIMISADLRHNLFDTEFINRSNDLDHECKDGLFMFRLLKKQDNGQPVGKIYCVYNGYDRALAASTTVGQNWVTRMGTVGVGTYDHWWWGWADDVNLLHPEIRHHTENFNGGKRLGYTSFSAHSYQWEDFMINFYKSKLG